MSPAPTAHNRLASLDLLRGVAAFAVAIPHYLVLAGSHSDAAETIAILGVEVFFTLSGFVLAPQILSCMRSQRLHDLWVFLGRRWMRTVPPFAFALVAMSVLSGQLGSADFFRYLLYVQNLAAQHNTSDYFPIAWSLSIEEWFYVTFPVLVFFLARWIRRGSMRFEVLAAIGFIAAVTIARTIFTDAPDWGGAIRRVVVFRVDSIAYGFLFYLLVGKAHQSEHVAIGGRGHAGLAFGGFALALAAASATAWAIAPGNSLIARHIFPFTAAALGVSSIHLFYCIGTRFEHSRAFAMVGDYLGKISYSTYLFHLIVAQLLVPAVQGLPIALQLTLFIVILMAFCTAFYAYFEKPILAARPRYQRTREQPALAQVS